MNAVHDEEVALINTLDTLLDTDEPVEPTLQAVLIHTVEHFSGEETMMQQSQFPPYPFHKSEHDLALEQLHRVIDDFARTGDRAPLKTYVRETLPQWIDNHIRTMDTVTAIFLATGLSPCAVR